MAWQKLPGFWWPMRTKTFISGQWISGQWISGPVAMVRMRNRQSALIH